MPRFLTLLLAGLVGLLALAPAAPAAKRMRSIFQDDCVIVQLSPEAQCYREGRSAALRAIRELGADTLRITVIRDKTRTFGWDQFDGAVQDALAHGLAPLIALTDRERTPTAKQFADFVRSAVSRYPRVHLWSLYNEPNLRYWLRSRSPRDYRQLVIAGQRAVRSVPGHRRDTVLMGDLAPHTTANVGTAVGPLRFTRELFCLDNRLRPYRGRAAATRGCRNFKRFTVDGFAVHPYTKAAQKAPNARDRGDGYSVATLGSLTRIIDAAARLRRTNRMSLWSTEMGFQSRPPVIDRRAPSLDQQAEYINWSDWIHYRNPRVASVSQYLLQDGVYIFNVSFNSGLRRLNGRPKPALNAYRLGIFPTRAGRGFVRVWAQARPGRVNRVTFERQTRGRGPFRRVATRATNPSGYVEPRFRGGPRDRWRVRWSRYTSRIARVR